MMLLSDTQQIRKADQLMIEGHGFPGILLMETAGRKAAEYILSHSGNSSHFLILAGPGNNGGDGLVIARYLQWAGKTVDILLAKPAQEYSGDAKIMWDALAGAGIPVWSFEEWQQLPARDHSPVLIDCLLGTGIESELRGSVADIIDFFQQKKWPCIAIDLPSGLDANTGFALNSPIPADYTLTFQLPKICLSVVPAADFCGEIIVVDIGIWPAVMDSLGIRRMLLTNEWLQSIYQKRQNAGHKGTYGHLLVIGGTRDMPGAIALSSHAALYMGAGLCTALIPGAARTPLFENGPAEVMALSGNEPNAPVLRPGDVARAIDALQGKAAWAMGPGMGTDSETAEFMRQFLKEIAQNESLAALPAILDADALNILAANPDLWDLLPGNVVLTPHPGEMGRLSPECDPINKRLEAAENLAKHRGCTVVLKGAGTIVAHANGQAAVNTTGNPGMGTAGSGDVLTGAIGALLAQGYALEIATELGVFLHGIAGDLCKDQFGQEGVTASRIMENLSPALQWALSHNSQNISMI